MKKKVARIISVQSTVLNDLVGNRAARYILEKKDYEIYEIPTIVLTSHKGNSSTIQLHSNSLNVWKIFQNTKKNYKIRSNDLTIIGYVPSKDSTKYILKIIREQKNIILDPVMGDLGVGLYVPKDVAIFFQKNYMKAKYLSANFFEWSFLNKKNISNYNLEQVIKDVFKFTKTNNSNVLIRSIPFNKKLINILASSKGVWGIVTPILKFKTRFHGAGDLTTALYAHHILKNNSEKIVLERLTNDIFQIISKKSLQKDQKFKAKNLNSL